ncbi:putative Na+/H+ antiporter [Kitasatospora phosalacinea]|uniref:Na+/H+ antiporter n=1 Tax=Kitasatospora phosalacinea TaxID=2065 RepID=A0A9W6V0F0_9ACTN|nr:cation:proton antiporter [Kitasatospora phosalacinea]GLW70759.1 putative Na+/H+ antiporter [Kitasatospora phosalacinea]
MAGPLFRRGRGPERSGAPRPGARRVAAVLLTVVLPLAVVLVVAVTAGGRAGGGSGRRSWFALSATGHVLLAVGVLLAAARLTGALVERLGQPRVVGEICAGIALGPSLLGRLAPGAVDWLFPRSVLAPLDGLAQFGLVLFMFGVGRELAGMRLRGAAARALLVSKASVLVPFALGAVAAVPLVRHYAGPHGSGPVFALFLGCALSITAFPVLARILSDLGITRTGVGQLSLFAAALGDGAGWLVLAAITAVAAGGDPSGLLVVGAAALALVGLYLGPLRALLARGAARGRSAAADVTVIALAVAVTAAATAALGVHQLIGALLVGLVWPAAAAPSAGAEPAGLREVARAADRVVGTARGVLLPLFFFEYGLTVDLGALEWGGSTVPVFLVLLALAVVGKVAGPGLCGWLLGLRPRAALALGVLLNARGLTELIVIQIGHDSGIVDDRMTAILTLVALGTTVMTAPLLRLLQGSGPLDGPALRLPDQEPAVPAQEPAGRR